MFMFPVMWCTVPVSLGARVISPCMLMGAPLLQSLIETSGWLGSQFVSATSSPLKA